MIDQASTPRVDGLMLSGLTELALGALTGWPYALAIADPDRARRLGIRSVGRLRQWHLDLIALGSISVLASLAIPNRPKRTSATLTLGSWTNAMSFGVLVLRPGLSDHPVYRAGVGGSFAITSAGFVGLTREGWRRWKRDR
ncbi:MAG TPA: hypothetical protein VFN55_10655 [Solirubrobacteraceae bacterium]|nr:hypothetical protein [Solirubrobacteraceae bacterium]